MLIIGERFGEVVSRKPTHLLFVKFLCCCYKTSKPKTVRGRKWFIWLPSKNPSLGSWERNSEQKLKQRAWGMLLTDLHPLASSLVQSKPSYPGMDPLIVVWALPQQSFIRKMICSLATLIEAIPYWAVASSQMTLICIPLTKTNQQGSKNEVDSNFKGDFFNMKKIRTLF